MNDPALSAMIREVLAEELQKLGSKNPKRHDTTTADVRTEEVSIGSDADLAQFVRKVLGFADDKKTRRDIEAGRLVFQLAGAAGGSSGKKGTSSQSTVAKSDTAEVASGMLSERQVDQLPRGIKTIRLGAKVRLTPLARDRLSHRGIRIERMEQ
jgi:hypothetical protein